MDLFYENFIISEPAVLFMLTGIIITFLVLLINRYYIKKNKVYYLILLIIFLASYIITVFTKNWILFIISWEMITLTTTLMLLWKGKGLASQYFIIQFLGTNILIIAIIMAIKSGYTEISYIYEVWLQNIFILGFGIKSAVMGFHIWLPAIYAKAPVLFNVISSGLVVNIGFITLLRLISQGNSFLLVVAILMIFFGGIKALKATDYKVILGYSTISQLGYIALGIGSGTIYGFVGAVIHIIAHGLAKTGLFISTGYLEKEYGTGCIYNFKNIWYQKKMLSISLLVGFFSLMGLPLFLGFNSKYLIKYGLNQDIVYTILLYGASIITILYSLRFLYWTLFKDILKKNKEELEAIQENFPLAIRDHLALITIMIILIITGLHSRFITVRINDLVIDYNLLKSVGEFLAFTLAGTLFLKYCHWYKISDVKIPSMDKEFTIINKYLHKFSLSLYSLVYQDFQYQLLWIPVIFIMLLLWTMF